MNTLVAKRIIQIAGGITLFFGLLLISLSLYAIVTDEPFLYGPCTAPMCELQVAPFNIDVLTMAHLVIIGIILCFFGNRIQKVERKDLSFFILTGFFVDLIVLFSGSLAQLERGLGSRYLSWILLGGFGLHLLCVLAVIAWRRYRVTKNPDLMPGSSWWVKIPMLILVIAGPILIYVIKALLGQV